MQGLDAGGESAAVEMAYEGGPLDHAALLRKATRRKLEADSRVSAPAAGGRRRGVGLGVWSGAAAVAALAFLPRPNF